MKVKLLVEFEVEGVEPGEDGEMVELTERDAKSAASEAAHHYLAFVEVSGYTSDSETVDVHADGYGKCRVRLGRDHE